MLRRVLLALAATAILAPATAGAASSDSLAPANAPPHWLPPEAWVYNHWLPYDEGRLYRLLRITRVQLWQDLRDDRQPLMDLARRRGWRSATALATALLAPRRAGLTPSRYRTLLDRARRTLTQGHLAQHVFFHSLHQFAIPSAAPDIFGLPDAQYRALRRAELSPLEIGRLHGRSPSRVQAMAAAVLRERVRAGVAGGAMTARQGALLLRRQLSQLPRWLGQARYNGPPRTSGGKLLAAPQDYASNPQISADGSVVAFEFYEQTLTEALRFGEIAVRAAQVGGAASLLVGPPGAADDPQSRYNPSLSADGNVVAYEAAAGNLNFAKRYGDIGVLAADRRAGTVAELAHPADQRGRLSRSSYAPAMSGDGRTVAFQAVGATGRSGVYARDLASGATVVVTTGAGGDAFEPSIDHAGARVAFTRSLRDGRSRVILCDLATRRRTAVSAPREAASSPAVAAAGRHVAYTASTRRGARVLVRDLATTTTLLASAGADRFALDPAISADGRVVAYTSVTGDRSRVIVRDLARGTRTVIAPGADGDVSDPSISADGTRVAFASDATNLDAGHTDGARWVYVADLRAGTVQAVPR